MQLCHYFIHSFIHSIPTTSFLFIRLYIDFSFVSPNQEIAFYFANDSANFATIYCKYLKYIHVFYKLFVTKIHTIEWSYIIDQWSRVKAFYLLINKCFIANNFAIKCNFLTKKLKNVFDFSSNQNLFFKALEIESNYTLFISLKLLLLTKSIRAFT